MAHKRGSQYYLKRRLPGIGPVKKSLGTKSATRAKELEHLAVSLAERGRLDLVRAWLDGGIDLAALADARDAGRLGELSKELQRSDTTLSDAIDGVLREKEADVSTATVQRYADGLRHLTAFAGEEASVRDTLTTEFLKEFKRQRLHDDAKKETVNNDLGAVSVLVTYAMRKGWIDERPEIKRFPTQVRIRHLEVAQVRLYLAALRPAFRVQMQLQLATGIRLGEAENLRVRDLKDGADGFRILISDSKTSTGVRTVFVPAGAAEAIRSHVQEQGLTDADRLFTIKRRSVQAEHRRACRLVGITKYTIHDHRHTAAVHLARAGMPLQLLQRQLGHKHIAMTMRYATYHPDYNDVAVYFDRVESSIGLDTVGPSLVPTADSATDNQTAGVV